MLSLLEGCEAMPSARPSGKRTKMRSHFVTFVGTGAAFVGMDVDQRARYFGGLAGASEGFIPEFIARWSMRIPAFRISIATCSARSSAEMLGDGPAGASVRNSRH